jgi:hypothetical protein
LFVACSSIAIRTLCRPEWNTAAITTLPAMID